MHVFRHYSHGIGLRITSQRAVLWLRETPPLDSRLAQLDPAAAARFDAYLALLLRWNARLNLTAVRKPEAIVSRHFPNASLLPGRSPRK